MIHSDEYKRNCEKVQYLRTVGNYRINLIIRYLMTVALGIRKKFLFVKNVKKDIGEVE